MTPFEVAKQMLEGMETPELAQVLTHEGVKD
jgi:hypothetical protein